MYSAERRGNCLKFVCRLRYGYGSCRVGNVIIAYIHHLDNRKVLKTCNIGFSATWGAYGVSRHRTKRVRSYSLRVSIRHVHYIVAFPSSPCISVGWRSPKACILEDEVSLTSVGSSGDAGVGVVDHELVVVEVLVGVAVGPGVVVAGRRLLLAVCVSAGLFPVLRGRPLVVTVRRLGVVVPWWSGQAWWRRNDHRGPRGRLSGDGGRERRRLLVAQNSWRGR